MRRSYGTQLNLTIIDNRIKIRPITSCVPTELHEYCWLHAVLKSRRLESMI